MTATRHAPLVALVLLLGVGSFGCDEATTVEDAGSLDAARAEDAGDDAAGPEDAGRPDACGECGVVDADGDGHAAAETGGDDCDDTDAEVYPGAMEVCDPDDRDEDCDPTTFGDRDVDGDSFVDRRCCNARGTSSERCGDDCDDDAAGIHPTEGETCDGIDNDCDLAIDEGAIFSWMPDCDRDGHGESTATAIVACLEPAAPPSTCSAGGWARNTTDCDDGDESIHLGAPEICDRRDNDCSSGGGAHSSEDADSDGHAPMDAACEGGPLPKDDCDDARDLTHLGAPELCGGIDEDCSSGGGVEVDCAPGAYLVTADGCVSGERLLRCNAGCSYEPLAPCSEELCIEPGVIESITCGDCGVTERFCTGGYEWESGECSDEGECTPGTTMTSEGCPSGQSREIVCTAACLLEPPGPCM